jgi:hypothetical protein
MSPRLEDGGMNWGVEDFAAAAVLLGVAAIALALVLRSNLDRTSRVLLAGAVVVVTLAIWAELAVGLL